MNIGDQVFLAYLEDWYEHRLPGVTQGLTMQLRRRTTGRSKNSASIELKWGNRIVQVVVWDSGEAEVTSADLIRNAEPLVTVLSVRTRDDVAKLLDAAVESVTAK